MNENFAIVIRAITVLGLAAILSFGVHSCMSEDHRHSETMRRLSSGCPE